MKKIGILTFHYVDNYGAVLQSYALKKCLDSLPECESNLINYIPNGYKDVPCGYVEYDWEGYKEKRKKFWHFLYTLCDVRQKEIETFPTMTYDYYCIGSDQVWNPIENNKVYMLGELSEDKSRFSYASSLGVSVEICKQKKEFYKDDLQKFKCISIREKEHQKFVEEISGKKCYQVVDPTLLLNAEQYHEIVCKTKLIEGDYVFFYWLEHDEKLWQGIEFVNSVARKFNCKIVHTIVGAKSYMFARDNICMMYDGVEEFLWYIENAKVVVTNSYHGMIFSMLFHTPFYGFVVELMRGRIDTLAEMLPIEERLVNTYIPIENLSLNMDFNSIDTKIKQKRKEAENYLSYALDIV